MTPTEQLHDLASRRRRFKISVDPSPAYDLLMSLWSATGGDDKARAHDLGAGWFDQFRKRIPAETAERMRAVVGERGHLWAGLVGYVAASHPRRGASASEVIDWLADQDLTVLRREMLAENLWEADPELLEAAAGGDGEALEQALAQLPAKKKDVRALLERVFAHDPHALAGELAEVLAEVHAAAFSEHEREWTKPLQASAESIRPLIGSLDPKDLIETITNGISYDLPLGTTELVLVPSVTLRPWTLVTEFGSAIVVLYPVADEHLSVDPDAPPSWLVKVYKALGDERRLRMLRRLAEGEANLTELTELVGLAKSTVFHHVGVLRSAGLIRVQLGGDRDAGPVYTLRTRIFEEAGSLLDQYLTPVHDRSRQGEMR